jgi:DNA-binding transcriptional LysR family regulator
MHLSDRIARRMKLQHLHVLMTVVQAGSMGKAAQRLNTVQPAVSRSIAELEHALGVRLLDRRRQGVEPTEYGRALLDCGAAVFDDLRQGMKNIEFLTDPTAGDVRIGCNPLLGATFVCAVIDRLSQRYPRFAFSVVTARVEALYRELRDRNVDLLIARRLGPIVDDRLEFEFLFEDSAFVAAGAHNPWVRRRRIALADLVNESWVLPPPEIGTGSLVMEAFRATGLGNPRTTVAAESPQVRMSLLATGRFLTIFADSMLRFSTRPPGLKVLPVELPIPRVPVGIVVLKNRALSPSARLFIDHARKLAKPLARGK